MKKITSPRPVSRKAYAGFVERISIIFPEPHLREAMLSALDRYIEGDREGYALGLTPECVRVFNMLRFDIDIALARSAKARARARRRKESPVVSPVAVVPADDVPVIEAEEVEAEDAPLSTQEVQDMIEMIRTLAEQYMAEEDDEEEACDYETLDDEVSPLTKTRRQRRAEQRMARSKNRWRKL